MSAESSPGEAARIHAALSHPYFSNHPSQTTASGIGDIVINNGSSTAKRKLPRLALFVVAGIIAIVVIISVAVLVSSANNNTESTRPIDVDEATVSVEENFEQVKYLEDLFYMSQFDRISFEEVFNEETSKKINQAISSVARLKKDLDRFNFDESDDALQQMYIINARNVLDERAGQYVSTVNLYNQVFEAYKNGDEAFFKDLNTSENENEAAIGKRFVDFFSTRNYWQKKMTEQGCKDNSNTEECVDAQKYYDQNQTSLSSDAPIPRMVFSVYINTPYGRSALAYSDLELVIEETDNEG